MSQPIKNFIYALVPPEMQWKITLLEHWEAIIGPMKDRVSIHAITNYHLILEVTHPAWAQELAHLTPLIKQKINTLLRADYIKDIRFNVASPRKSTNPQAIWRAKYSASFLKKRKQTSYTLNVNEEKALTSINDEDLQEVMRAFLISCKQT